MVQSQFNNEALQSLTKVFELIENADGLERNQMAHVALREIMNSSVPIDSMSESQLDKFQNDLIERFEYNGWVKE